MIIKGKRAIAMLAAKADATKVHQQQKILIPFITISGSLIIQEQLLSPDTWNAVAASELNAVERSTVSSYSAAAAAKALGCSFFAFAYLYTM